MTRTLTVNLGSSSLKLSVLQPSDNPYLTLPEPLWERSLNVVASDDLATTVQPLIAELPSDITQVVHRVVHGGTYYSEQTLLSEEVKQRIQELGKFAPLHNPRALELINILQVRLPGEHYAAFDTAFFSQMSEVESSYALPKSLRDSGMRRYGFHGLSHSFSLKRIAAVIGKAPQRLIVFHLGSGCSVSAILNGQPIYCSMGFSPLEGLVMGTRCGSIDPGLVLQLCRQMSVDEVEKVLTKQSGLLGLSGQSADMRDVIVGMSSSKGHRLAFESFLRSLVIHSGSCFALLGGADVVVFTGGIGENSKEARDALLERCSFLPSFSPIDQVVSGGLSRFSTVVNAREDIEMTAGKSVYL